MFRRCGLADLLVVSIHVPQSSCSTECSRASVLLLYRAFTCTSLAVGLGVHVLQPCCSTERSRASVYC
jgi:hypothetical protein